MIYLKILDNAGLGNQLFMFAMGYSLARKTGLKITILSEFNKWSKREYILNELDLDNHIMKEKLDFNKSNYYYIFRLIKKTRNLIYRHSVFITQIRQPLTQPNLYINNIDYHQKKYFVEGYWENYKYFDQYEDELRLQFNVKLITDKYTLDMIEYVKKCQSVAVHIRKGDFVDEGRAFDIAYFKIAMRQMRELIPNCKFFVFSQDKEAKLDLSDENDVICIDGNEKTRDIDEWMIMKNCRNHILSNSTFSWWAAYLADNQDKIILRPSLKTIIDMENRVKSCYESLYKDSWIEVQ